jgi:hypothetical protein
MPRPLPNLFGPDEYDAPEPEKPIEPPKRARPMPNLFKKDEYDAPPPAPAEPPDTRSWGRWGLDVAKQMGSGLLHGLAGVPRPGLDPQAQEWERTIEGPMPGKAEFAEAAKKYLPAPGTTPGERIGFSGAEALSETVSQAPLPGTIISSGIAGAGGQAAQEYLPDWVPGKRLIGELAGGVSAARVGTGIAHALERRAALEPFRQPQAEPLRAEIRAGAERETRDTAAAEARLAQEEAVARAGVQATGRETAREVAGLAPGAKGPLPMSGLEAGEVLATLPPPIRGKPFIREGATAEEIAQNFRFETPEQLGAAVRFYRSLRSGYGAASEAATAAKQGIYSEAMSAANPAAALTKLAGTTLGREVFSPPELRLITQHAEAIRSLEQNLARIAQRRQEVTASWARMTDPAIGGEMRDTFRRIISGEASLAEVQGGIFHAMRNGASPAEISQLVRAIENIAGPQAVTMLRMGIAQQLLANINPVKITRKQIQPFFDFVNSPQGIRLFGQDHGQMQTLARTLYSGAARMQTTEQAANTMRHMNWVERNVVYRMLRRPIERHPLVAASLLMAGAGEIAESFLTQLWPHTRGLLWGVPLGLALFAGRGALRTARDTPLLYPTLLGRELKRREEAPKRQEEPKRRESWLEAPLP